METNNALAMSMSERFCSMPLAGTTSVGLPVVTTLAGYYSYRTTNFNHQPKLQHHHQHRHQHQNQHRYISLSAVHCLSSLAFLIARYVENSFPQTRRLRKRASFSTIRVPLTLFHATSSVGSSSLRCQADHRHTVAEVARLRRTPPCSLSTSCIHRKQG